MSTVGSHMLLGPPSLQRLIILEEFSLEWTNLQPLPGHFRMYEPKANKSCLLAIYLSSEVEACRDEGEVAGYIPLSCLLVVASSRGWTGTCRLLVSS